MQNNQVQLNVPSRMKIQKLIKHTKKKKKSQIHLASPLAKIKSHD